MRMVGKGSKTTVVDAMADWWEMTMKKLAEEKRPDGISSEAYQLAQQLYQMILKSASDSAQDVARKELEADREKLESAAAIAREAADAAERTRDVALDRAGQEANRREAIEAQLTKVLVEMESCREQLAETRAKLEGKEAVINGLTEAKKNLTDALVKQEEAADQREEALQRQVKELQAERTERERREERKQEEHAQAQAGLRELLANQRGDAERERVSMQKAIEERDSRLASVREEVGGMAKALAAAEKESAELRGGMRELERVVSQLQQTNDAAAARAEKDSAHIRELEKQLAEASSKGKGQRK